MFSAAEPALALIPWELSTSTAFICEIEKQAGGYAFLFCPFFFVKMFCGRKRSQKT
jgi:hypothetical protein